MDETLTQRLKALSSAEDFLGFFGVQYDAPVVHVNRLHILKRFFQYLRAGATPPVESDVDMFRRYRELLTRAYQDFVESTPAREKVFKVFQDTDGTQHVGLASLRASLPARPAPAGQTVTS
jgi:nitrogenase-stabilizing/protective protein